MRGPFVISIGYVYVAAPIRVHVVVHKHTVTYDIRRSTVVPNAQSVPGRMGTKTRSYLRVHAFCSPQRKRGTCKTKFYMWY